MQDNLDWAIIPAYNEEERIISVTDKIKQYIKNIVVIDDGSYNDLNIKGVYLLKHLINLGKGSALKTGIEFAIRKGAKQFILLDSDGQHDPDEIPKFLNALKEYEMVFGYRQGSENMPWILRFGNKSLTKITKLLFKVNLKDVQCGYRAFTLKTYKKINWTAKGYEVENEMIANVGMHKILYTEIPIQAIYTDKYKGTTILDGIRIILKMISWKLKRNL